MQMMPGLVSPARGIVFNEKTFRYAVFDDPAGILPADRNGLSDLLEARSGHGPVSYTHLDVYKRQFGHHPRDGYPRQERRHRA